MKSYTSRVFEALPANEGKAEDHVGQRLREIREQMRITQTELAERLGMHQSSLSRIERQADILVSTLRLYIEGIGAKLRIDASFESTNPRVSHFEESAFIHGATDEDQLILPIVGDDHFPPRRDVVFSIKPHYAEDILTGRKTIELRRRFPIDVPSGTSALIYTSSPTRALTGIAEIQAVMKQSPEAIWRAFAKDACVTRKDFDGYFAGLDVGFAIRLAQARPLRRQVQLSELRDRFCFEPPQSFLYAKPELRQALSYEFSKLSN